MSKKEKVGATTTIVGKLLSLLIDKEIITQKEGIKILNETEKELL